ncbi:MAG TPA: response regulator [Dissulfurispiraceae bacterium]|nr:response regulator [Dissulfurispiraceae bacterium]
MTSRESAVNTCDIKVLLVDDEQAFVDTLAQRLRLRSLDVHAVYDGSQALAFLMDQRPEEEPHVIVLDLKMPDMSGLEVLRRVKKYYPRIEVIMLTGHGDDKDAEEARRVGSFDFLKKPTDIDALLGRIRDAHRVRIEKAAS